MCRVKEFGPLIVSIDTHGNNLIAENKSCSLNVATRSSKKSASTCTTSNNPPGEAHTSPLSQGYNNGTFSWLVAIRLRWWSSPLLLFCPFTAVLKATRLYFAVFTGVIVGLILEPVPGAVVAMIGISIIAVLSPWLLFSPEQLAGTDLNLPPNRCHGRCRGFLTRLSG